MGARHRAFTKWSSRPRTSSTTCAGRSISCEFDVVKYEVERGRQSRIEGVPEQAADLRRRPRPPQHAYRRLRRLNRTCRGFRAPRVVNISDLRRLAQRRLPAGGVRLHRRRSRRRGHAWRKLPRLRRRDVPPAPGVAIPRCDLRTRVLGTPIDFHSCSRPSEAAACSGRAAKRWPHSRRARPAPSTCSRRYRGAGSRMSKRQQPGRRGISSISSAGTTRHGQPSPVRAQQASPRSSSRRHAQSQACGSATCETGSRN